MPSATELINGRLTAHSAQSLHLPTSSLHNTTYSWHAAPVPVKGVVRGAMFSPVNVLRTPPPEATANSLAVSMRRLEKVLKLLALEDSMWEPLQAELSSRCMSMSRSADSGSYTAAL